MDDISICLYGWDRLWSWRSHISVGLTDIVVARLVERGVLEDRIDHRVSGFGAHNGANRPGRRRVGVMLGRDVIGRQFWAVPRTGRDAALVVLDVRHPEFARLVFDQDTSGLSDTDVSGLGPSSEAPRDR